MYPALRSGGIFNCRRVAGSGVWSLHAEGRAVDLMVPGDHYPELGDQLVAQLGIHASALQVSRAIWDRRVFDHESPTGRPYSGQSPHTDHVHLEQTWAGARTLTRATVDALLGGTDWLDMATLEEVKTAMRQVLNEGTGLGQRDWAGTSRATLSDVQGNRTILATIAAGVRALVDR